MAIIAYYGMVSMEVGQLQGRQRMITCRYKTRKTFHHAHTSNSLLKQYKTMHRGQLSQTFLGKPNRLVRRIELWREYVELTDEHQDDH